MRAIDPEGDDPTALLAAAAAVWLSRHPARRDAGDQAIREGVRPLFSAQPPDPVADWRATRGIVA